MIEPRNPSRLAVEKRVLAGPFRRLGLEIISSCPSQDDSDDHREKSESPQGQSIDCTEPQNLAPLSPHASHPFSGVLPRKIQ
jgi:hypothetical protein